MQHQSSEEFIARFIAQAFPAANLKIEGEGDQVVYEILLNEKMLVRLDRICAVFNFPTQRPGKITWSGIKEGGPETIAELIVRYLADAGFTVSQKLENGCESVPYSSDAIHSVPSAMKEDSLEGLHTG